MQDLTPASPSPALARALALAAGGKFIDLLAEEPCRSVSEACAQRLTGLALYSIGDASALVQFQRAYALGGPAAPIQFLTGAVRATQNRDADAIAAWQSAKDEGFAAVAPFLVEAYLRRNERRAGRGIGRDGARRPARRRRLGANGGRHPPGDRPRRRRHCRRSTRGSRRQPGDLDAQWLLLQALYGADRARTASGDRDRFAAAAQAYITAGGPNAALAEEWLQADATKT